MFTTVALMAAALSISPGQATSGLTLGNPRVTYGELGSARPDAKLLPGDIFFLSFDIEGIKATNAGKVKYGMVMEVMDSSGKSIFKQPPVEREDYLPLGGTKLPARAFVSIGVEQPPGTYTCKVAVSDLSAKEPVTKTLEQKFELLPRNFGIVQVYAAADPKGEIPASLYGVTGQFFFLHMVIIDFQRDPKTKQPNITVEMTVYDKDSKPTLEKPTQKLIPDEADMVVDEKTVGIPLRFLVPMNREGGYVIRMTATDNVTKKTAKVDLPLRVFPSGS